MTYQEIKLDLDGYVATVTLNRPDKLNAVTPTLYNELRTAMDALGKDDAVRVIILTGAGKGFCAGADMGRLTEFAGGSGIDALARPDTWPINPDVRADLQQRYSFLASVPKPVIAAVNGAAVGIGLMFALFSDMRFAAANATLMTGFARRGLIAEHGSAWMLSRLVGPSRASDLLLSSRKVSGTEAAAMGLVDRALPADELMAFTRAYAQDMACNTSPLSLRIIKQQLWDVPFQTLGESLAEGDKKMMASLRTHDFKEGVAHFVEKRAPHFTGT